MGHMKATLEGSNGVPGLCQRFEDNNLEFRNLLTQLKTERSVRSEILQKEQAASKKHDRKMNIFIALAALIVALAGLILGLLFSHPRISQSLNNLGQSTTYTAHVHQAIVPNLGSALVRR